MRKIKLGAIAVALTLATALPVAKTVGGAVKKGAGSVIRHTDVGRVPLDPKALRNAGRLIKSTARVVGRAAKQGVKATGKGLARVGRALPFGAKFNPRVSSTRGGHPNKSPAVQQRQR
jgi:hypothetical protein